MAIYMRNYNQPKGLAHKEVLINDTLDSSRYFVIDDFPNELTAGKNLFKLKGDRNLLKEGTPIEIEVIDRNGDVRLTKANIKP